MSKKMGTHMILKMRHEEYDDVSIDVEVGDNSDLMRIRTPNKESSEYYRPIDLDITLEDAEELARNILRAVSFFRENRR